MVKRISALEGHYQKGIFGKQDNLGIELSEVRNLILFQVGAWPSTLNEVGTKVSKLLKLAEYPKANKASSISEVSMLRVEPLKWWVIGREIFKSLLSWAVFHPPQTIKVPGWKSPVLVTTRCSEVRLVSRE